MTGGPAYEVALSLLDQAALSPVRRPACHLAIRAIVDAITLAAWVLERAEVAGGAARLWEARIAEVRRLIQEWPTVERHV